MASRQDPLIIVAVVVVLLLIGWCLYRRFRTLTEPPEDISTPAVAETNKKDISPSNNAIMSNKKTKETTNSPLNSIIVSNERSLKQNWTTYMKQRIAKPPVEEWNPSIVRSSSPTNVIKTTCIEQGNHSLWQEHVDEDTGSYFYYNKKTKSSTWVVPEQFVACVWRVAWDEQITGLLFTNSITGETAANDLLNTSAHRLMMQREEKKDKTGKGEDSGDGTEGNVNDVVQKEKKEKVVEDEKQFSIIKMNAKKSRIKTFLRRPSFKMKVEKNIGHTALHHACSYGRADVVKTLIDVGGIDVNQTNKEGITALHEACENGYVDVVEILLNAKDIDVNITNQNGLSALDIAREEEEDDIVELLLRKGVKK